MTDVRDLFDQLLDAPAPAMRPAGDVLAAARRSAARRRRAGIASAGLLTAAAVAAGAFVVPTLTGGGAAPAAAPQAPPFSAAASIAPSAAAERPAPRARAAAVHGRVLTTRLRAAVPPGYATPDFPIELDDALDPDRVLPDATYRPPAGGMMSAATGGVLLRAGGGEGMLTAGIWAFGEPAPDSEECADGHECSEHTIGGVTVRVSTWRDESGRHISAGRPLRGGRLIVSASQGLGGGDERTRTEDGFTGGGRVKPSLPELPFTPDQIAALAADPAMLQFR